VVFDRWHDRYADRLAGVRSSAVRDLFAAASRPDMISLSGGMPAVGMVPHDVVASAARDAVKHEGAAALQYGSSNGRPQIRRLVAELMAEIGVRLSADDVLITAGAQQALDLLAKTFVNPGDVIIAEGPTYVGALQAFSAYQPEIRCVPMDDDGMRMDLLEAELRRVGVRGAKFIYTIPNFQNPAGVTMSPERRRRLLELAREYDIPVVEDDPYGRLRFDGGHMKPLRALDDEVIYLGTFSKIFAPGLRLGWVTAPKPILAKILLVKQAADLCGSNFAQVTAERYFQGTRWRRVLQGLTSTYAEPSAEMRCSPRSRSTSRLRRAGPSPTAGSLSGSNCRSSSTATPCSPRRSSAASPTPRAMASTLMAAARTACASRSATPSPRRSTKASDASPRWWRTVSSSTGRSSTPVPSMPRKARRSGSSSLG
jgi:2-aminoadipate transaminase